MWLWAYEQITNLVMWDIHQVTNYKSKVNLKMWEVYEQIGDARFT